MTILNQITSSLVNLLEINKEGEFSYKETKLRANIAAVFVFMLFTILTLTYAFVFEVSNINIILCIFMGMFSMAYLGEIQESIYYEKSSKYDFEIVYKPTLTGSKVTIVKYNDCKLRVYEVPSNILKTKEIGDKIRLRGLIIKEDGQEYFKTFEIDKKEDAEHMFVSVIIVFLLGFITPFIF